MAESEKYRTRALDCTCTMAVCRCPVDHIVFYDKNGEWVVESTADKQVKDRGTLADMMALVDGPDCKFPGRRAHHAEDMLRQRPRIFDMDFDLNLEPEMRDGRD